MRLLESPSKKTSFFVWAFTKCLACKSASVFILQSDKFLYTLSLFCWKRFHWCQQDWRMFWIIVFLFFWFFFFYPISLGLSKHRYFIKISNAFIESFGQNWPSFCIATFFVQIVSVRKIWISFPRSPISTVSTTFGSFFDFRISFSQQY